MKNGSTAFADYKNSLKCSNTQIEIKLATIRRRVEEQMKYKRFRILISGLASDNLQLKILKEI
jgi:ATP-dependent helicase/DNAse subunit B